MDSDDTLGHKETQKQGPFLGLIGLLRWKGFLIHPISAASYPERGCRAAQWLCDGFPVQAVNTYSEDWQAVISVHVHVSGPQRIRNLIA